MFTRRTLFVLGAGSSFEAGLPLGVLLAKIIRNKMDVRFERGFDLVGDGDTGLFSHISHVHREDMNAYLQAASRIGKGLGFAQSIDDFLDQHRTDAYLNHYGKASIVRAVLEAEKDCKLWFDPNAETDRFNPNWPCTRSRRPIIGRSRES